MRNEYLLLQPTTLESMALKKLGEWIVSHGTMIRSSTPGLQLDTNEAEHLLSRRIQIIRNHLELQMPGFFYDKLATEVIWALRPPRKTSCWHGIKFMSGNSKKTGRMIEALFTENLTSLSLANYTFWDVFRNLLCYKSYKLTGLVDLKLRLKRNVPEADIIQLLKQLHSLKYLSLTDVCTDNILECIAENCKLIVTLDLTHSYVNDKSMIILSELSDLRSVDLKETAATETGIETLLMSCENIEQIGTDADIAQVLEHIASRQQYAGKQFKLKFYENSYPNTLEQTQLVVKMCPLIHTIRLSKDEISQNYQNAFHDLQNLREFKLDGHKFYADRVKELLEARGRYLVNLNLKEVRQMDLNCFKYICAMCPNLQSLTITECNIYVKETLVNDLFPSEVEIPPLRYLKRLTLEADYSTWPTDQQLIFLLSNCPNVEYIDASELDSLTDTVMLQVLEKIPKSLMYLKELKICEKLSPLVIDRIVQHCVSHPVVKYDW